MTGQGQFYKGKLKPGFTRPPVSGSKVADWNAAESEAVTLGSDGARYRLHSLLISIHNLVGTIITVKMYMKINNTERQVYQQTFDSTSDPPGLWLVNGTVAIHEALRVTLESNNPADDGKAIDYDYLLEVM